MAKARTLVLNTKVNVTGADQLRGLGRTLQKTGGLLTTGLTLPLVGFGAAMLTAAQDAERAQAKLTNTFKSMGAATFTSVKALNAHAKALQDATTFDDESITEAQAVLLTFGKVTGKAFERATEAALDMTALFEGDLQAATIGIGKALNDPIKGVTALTRVGVSFTQQQKDQIKVLAESGDLLGAQTIILAELEKQFGGTAEALAGTAGGQMTQALNQLGEAAEEFGAVFVPVLLDVANGLKDFAKWLQQLNPETKEWVLRIGLLAAALGPVLIVVGSLVRVGAALGTVFQFLFVGKAVGELSRLGGAAKIAWDALAKLADVASGVGSAIGNALSGVARVARAAVVRAATLLGAAFSAAFSAAATAVEAIGTGLATGLRAARAALARAAILLGVVFAGAFAGAVNVTGFVADWAGSILKIGRKLLARHAAFLGGIFSVAFDVGTAAADRIRAFAGVLLKFGQSRLAAAGGLLGTAWGTAFAVAATAAAVAVPTAIVAAFAAGFATDFLGMRTRLEKDVADFGVFLGDAGDAFRGFFSGWFGDDLTEPMEEFWNTAEEAAHDGMRGIGTVFREGAKLPVGSVAGMALAILEILDIQKAKMRNLGFQQQIEYAKGLLDAQNNVKVAIEAALQITNDLMTKQEEINYLSGQRGTLMIALGIASAEGKPTEALEGALALLRQRLGDLGVEFYTSGINLVSGLAAGIKANLGVVVDAGRQLASSLRRTVAIESEPKDHSSPLYGHMKWGGNLVRDFADSMLRAVPDVSSAAAVMGRAIGIGGLPGLGSASPVPAMGSAGMGGATNIYNNFTFSGTPSGSPNELSSLLRDLSAVSGGNVRYG